MSLQMQTGSGLRLLTGLGKGVKEGASSELLCLLEQDCPELIRDRSVCKPGPVPPATLGPSASH